MPLLRQTKVAFPGNDDVERFDLENDQLKVSLLSYGATIDKLLVPDRNGAWADVALGFDDPTAYAGQHPYFGAVIGRFANRVAAGRFELAGKTYQLPVNQDPNSLHGGVKGFDRQVWTPQRGGVEDAPSLVFSLTSPDGDMGYPGTVEAQVTYTLRGRELAIAYRATTDQTTVINLTNHAYFNLAGAGSGTVEDHVLSLAASRYTPVDGNLIPTGELAPVEGTPMDFRAPKRIGTDLRTTHQQLVFAQGYDHNWVLDAPMGTARLAASVYDPSSGRALEVFTDQPGIQFYSGNFLDGTLIGKGGRTYRQGDGFCLETQHFPDSPNQGHFPSTVLSPGETYATTTSLRFGFSG